MRVNKLIAILKFGPNIQKNGHITLLKFEIISQYFTFAKKMSKKHANMQVVVMIDESENISQKNPLICT